MGKLLHLCSKIKMKSFSIILLGLFFSCCKHPHPEFVRIEFELPATITPVRDTVNLGDTLLFSMNFPDILKDAVSGNSYKIKNFSFNLFLRATRIGDSTKSMALQELATHKFTYFSILGGFVNTSSVATHFRLNYNPDNYQASCKILPKERGVYVFGIVYEIPSDNGIPDSILSLPDANGKKQIPFLISPIFLFNNGNTNFSLLQKNAKVPNTIYGGPTTDLRGFYTFAVK